MSEQKNRVNALLEAKDRHVALAMASFAVRNRKQFDMAPSAVGEHWFVTIHDVDSCDAYKRLKEELTERPVVDFVFDGEEESYGRFSVTPNGWGADLSVQGRTVGTIDLFKDSDGEESVPCFIFDGPGDEVAAKVSVDGFGDNGPITVIVNGNFAGQKPLDHPRSIHSDGRDHVFQFLGAENKSGS